MISGDPDGNWHFLCLFSRGFSLAFSSSLQKEMKFTSVCMTSGITRVDFATRVKEDSLSDFDAGQSTPRADLEENFWGGADCMWGGAPIMTSNDTISLSAAELSGK